ncbi:branched-chain amino acid ABC transporter substrate-binding protein [Mesorhizobium sp. M0965]|uniref:branched-chain amino acid ABC transporter substrate-binding protein n=1 Tax=Mesorhizobium sp. M0965 TaxID=2957036 RepID=UPI00333797A4
MSKLPKRFVLLRLLGLAVFALLATIAPRLAVAESSDIPMAVVGPMTGDWAVYGEEMRRGAQLAADDINGEGGIGGRKITLTFLDDEGRPDAAISVARKLAKGGVRFVIGHYNSGASIPASIIYAKNNTLMVSPASTNPALTDAKLWNTIRTAGRDDVQGTFAGEYMAGHFSARNLAIVSDGTPYGDGLAAKARKALLAKRRPEKLFSRIEPGQANFSRLVAKIEAAKIGAVFFAGLADDFGRLIRETSEAGLKVQFISGDGAMVKDLSAIAGPAVEGTLIMFSFEDRDNPAAQEVVRRFRSQGFEPEAYTLKTYAAVQVIANGIKMAGVQAPRAVAASIRSGQPIPTVVGDLTFDAKGDRRERDVRMYVWRKQADRRFMLDAAD